MAKLAAEGRNSIPNDKVFDSNCITPGTEFMLSLNEAFRDWISSQMKGDPFWKQSSAQVIFSGSDCPGEGEHKIMDYIRRARQEKDWSPDLRHVMYGLDADLIMVLTY